MFNFNKREALAIFDMHCHTKEGSMDGLNPVAETVCKMKALGYTGVVLCDHNSYKGYETWLAEKDKYPELEDFTVIKALEYDTRNGGHVLCILPEGVELDLLCVRGMTVKKLLKTVHSVGGICGMCHPYGPGFFAAMHTRAVKNSPELQKAFDFVESYNAHLALYRNELAEIFNLVLKKPVTAGTDAHKLKYVGSAATAFTVPIHDRDDLIRAIRNNDILYAGPAGDITHPVLKGPAKWGGIAGYWVWNKAAAGLYTRRRKRAWKQEKNG